MSSAGPTGGPMPSSDDLLIIASFGPTGPYPLIVDPMGVTGFMATGPTGEYFIPYQPTSVFSTYIMTIEDLMSSRDAIIHTETNDRSTLLDLSSPNENALRSSLFQWAGAGFPDIFPIASVSIIPPAVCSDGVTRVLFDYVPYLTGKSISEIMEVLQVKLHGMQLSYSLPNNGIMFHVSK